MTRLALAAALSGLTLLGACGGKPETPPAPPALPQGRLLLVGSGVTESRFLALDQTRKGDGVVEVAVLLVGASPTSLANKSAMIVKREVIDCGSTRTSREMAAYYDAAGKLAHAEEINTGRMGRPMEPSETEAGIACGTTLAKGRTLTGWQAALRDVQSPPASLAKIAKADDFHSQAWLCAATLRRRVPTPAAEACDRALALKPDDLAVRLDHGFRSLVSGAPAKGKADFDAILGKDPNNADALVGRGLAAALQSGPAAARPDVAKALAIDPKAVERVEATYKVSIGLPYR